MICKMNASYNDGQGGMVMEDVVLGIDLGTSAVKIIAVNRQGEVIASTSEPLTLIQDRAGYSEQDPEEWFKVVKKGIKIHTSKMLWMKQNEPSFWNEVSVKSY